MLRKMLWLAHDHLNRYRAARVTGSREQVGYHAGYALALLDAVAATLREKGRSDEAQRATDLGDELRREIQFSICDFVSGSGTNAVSDDHKPVATLPPVAPKPVPPVPPVPATDVWVNLAPVRGKVLSA